MSAQGTFRVIWDVEQFFVVWDSPELSGTSAIFDSGPLNLPITVERPKISFTDFQNCPRGNCCFRFRGSRGNLTLLITVSVGNYLLDQRNRHVLGIINSF